MSSPMPRNTMMATCRETQFSVLALLQLVRLSFRAGAGRTATSAGFPIALPHRAL
jgi:hypothetical protein